MSNKNTLIITGAAGFIGSNVVRKATSMGFQTIGIDTLEFFEERKHLDLPSSMQTFDISDTQEVLEKNASKIAGIIHMGACTDTTELNEIYLKEVNLDYSKILWDFCTENKTPLVYASSAATYGDGFQGYSDDEKNFSKLKPLNPYGNSKHLFDLWALEEEKKGHHPPSWSGFKFFNVYGPGEDHKGKMASVMYHAFNQIKQRGYIDLFKSHRDGIADGYQRRDFVHVHDVVEVLFFALTKPLARGIYNLGTGIARPYLDLGKAVFKSMEAKEDIRFIDMPVAIRERYQYFTEAEMQKLKAAGYKKEFLTLEKGIQQYVEFLISRQK